MSRLDVGAQVTAHAAATPDRIAVQYGAQNVTYRDFQRQVDRLARRLKHVGVGRGDCVLVSTDRPLEAIVSFFAAMQVGACYSPIAADAPSQRKRFVIEETGAQWWLSASFPEDLDDEIKHFRTVLDCDGAVDKGCCLARDTYDADPAYVIFTSGSTGKPKGVVISRGNLSYSTVARHQYYRDPVERFLLLSPLTFDSSVAGIYWTLTTGGTLVLPTEPVNHQVTNIHDAIREHDITHLLCIPSLWNLLLSEQQVDGLGSLRTVVVAGEACPRQLAARHLQLLPAATLYNEYGPTEATVWCTVQRIVADESGRPVPIGKPIPGTRIHVLNADLQPVPQGVEGELFVAGPGVAQGYLGRPELTDDRFLPDPRSETGALMYRTGDFGKWLADGTLAYGGRRDGQVKIRGHRIEIEEIENVLADHDRVQEAAVVAVNERLVGFVVSEDRQGSSKLKEFAASRLPGYMIPHRLIAMGDLPRTKHGKVDRETLERLAVDDERRRDPVTVTAPPLQDETQRLLAETWQRLLNQSQIGADDCFFELGGDSLRAMELALQVERQWNVQLELTQILTHSTIRSLSRLIQGSPYSKHDSCMIPINPRGTRTPLFCIHPGGGNVICYAPLARELDPDQPLYAIRAYGVEPGEEPIASVEDMAAAYIKLIREVQPHGPYAIAGWSFGGIVSYEIARQLEQAGEELKFVGVIDGSPVYSIAVLKEIFPNTDIPISRIKEEDADEHFELFRIAAAEAMILPFNAAHEHARRVLGLFASTLRAAVDYRPKPLNTTVSLLVAQQKLANIKYEPYRDWKRSCDTLELHEVPGSHLDMMKPPHVGSLARKLQTLLDAGNVQWQEERVEISRAS